jgi:hypothetical protein
MGELVSFPGRKRGVQWIERSKSVSDLSPAAQIALRLIMRHGQMLVIELAQRMGCSVAVARAASDEVAKHFR